MKMSNEPTMDEAFIEKLKSVVELNLKDSKFGVDELVEKSGLSRSEIFRKIQQVKHQSIEEFILEIRLYKALELLQTGQGSPAVIASKTGFISMNNFNKSFKKYFGHPPWKTHKFKKDLSQEPVDPVLQAKMR